MILGKLDRHMQKSETGLLSYTIYKNPHSKWIKNLNVRPEIIKPEDNKVVNSDIGFSNIFLDMSPPSRETKAKRNKWDSSIKLKTML